MKIASFGWEYDQHQPEDRYGDVAPKCRDHCFSGIVVRSRVNDYQRSVTSATACAGL